MDPCWSQERKESAKGQGLHVFSASVCVAADGAALMHAVNDEVDIPTFVLICKRCCDMMQHKVKL